MNSVIRSHRFTKIIQWRTKYINNGIVYSSSFSICSRLNVFYGDAAHQNRVPLPCSTYHCFNVNLYIACCCVLSMSGGTTVSILM